MSLRTVGWIAFVLSFGVVMLLPPLRAASDGINGWSGNPAVNGGLDCSFCHDGGVVPTVTLSGPTQVQPGSLHSYTLTISGGQQQEGGLDVSATGGAFVGSPFEGTQVLFGELTHTTPKAADVAGEVSWDFEWRAPLLSGSATLYAAGNSVNGTQGTNGDAASTDFLKVTVGGVPLTPGETSAPELPPLRVTGIGPGQISITYGTGCEATSNNIYYGPLSQVASLGWSGDTCDIGSSGVHTWVDPPELDSFFFVVVGTKDLDTGSYGRSLGPGGVQTERPDLATGTCVETQNLGNTCD